MNEAELIGTRSKIVSAILMAILLVSSMLAFVPFALAATPPSAGDNVADYGVLDSETYVTYPWEDKSIDVGFSKYGELINDVVPLGLKYDGIDVFANLNVPKKDWVGGWVIDIHYVDENGVLKNTWAYAIYSDRDTYDEDWKQEQTSWLADAVGDVHGGRRTNGYVVTDPIRLIYDGPRRSIHLLKHTIYDEDPADQGTALLQIEIQMIFNKDKKYILEIKDIKRLERSKWTGPFQIEFSQREEWDIGTTSQCKAYAEFYDGLDTKYDKHPFYGSAEPEYEEARYDVVQLISTETDVDLTGFHAFWPHLQGKWIEETTWMLRERSITSLTTVAKTHTITTGTRSGFTFVDLEWDHAVDYARGDGVWSDEPWVFVNDHWLPTSQWTWTPGTAEAIAFVPQLSVGDVVTVLYKAETFGLDEHLDVHDIGSGTSYGMSEEPNVPFVIGEWVFDLDFDNEEHSTHQFRAVSVVGVTDSNDGYDGDSTDPKTHSLDKIDSEVMFQLDEVFNPWDLNDAAHKSSFRWAQKGTIPTSKIIALNSHSVSHPDYNDVSCLDTVHTVIVVPAANWGDYLAPADVTNDRGRTSERVILYDAAGTLPPKLLERDGIGPTDDYTFSDSTITITASTTGYEYYKVLYSTWIPTTTSWDTGRWEWIIVGRDSHAADSAGAAMVSIAWEEWKGKQVWLSALDIWGVHDGYTEGNTIPYVFNYYWIDTESGVPLDRTYYYYHYETDKRAELKDDWSTPDDWAGELIYPYAITTSNIIIVGGPIASLAAEKYNDFTDAFVFSKYGDGFYSYACWARTSQPSVNKVGHEPPPGLGVTDDLWYDSVTEGDDVGHAIISTYLDPWGTIAFVVYGYTAEDTYYASYAVRGGLLPWLQELQAGVTTLVLGFDYETIHPVEIHVHECLGTITECTGFESNFKDDASYRVVAAGNAVAELASSAGLCYKLIDITWCAELHPDP